MRLVPRRYGAVGLLTTRLGRRGVAALEFALIAPMYLLLLIGVVAYGLYCTMQIAVTAAASEGARAAVGMLQSDATYSPAQQARSTACAVLNGYSPLLQCTSASSSNISVSQVGNQLRVSVSYPFSRGSFIGLVPLPSGNPRFTATVTIGLY